MRRLIGHIKVRKQSSDTWVTNENKNKYRISTCFARFRVAALNKQAHKYFARNCFWNVDFLIVQQMQTLARRSVTPPGYVQTLLKHIDAAQPNTKVRIVNVLKIEHRIFAIPIYLKGFSVEALKYYRMEFEWRRSIRLFKFGYSKSVISSMTRIFSHTPNGHWQNYLGSLRFAPTVQSLEDKS